MTGVQTCALPICVTVFHRPRRSFREAWRQRVGYGSAATGLHQRHPGHVAPLRVNRWSIAAWGALAAGHALVAVATTAGSIVLLARKLGNFSDRIPIAVRLAGLGNAHAGRLIASALTRTWWPITLIVCLVSRRARRVAAIAAVAPHLWSWLTERPDLDPIRYSLLGIADDGSPRPDTWFDAGVTAVQETLTQPDSAVVVHCAGGYRSSIAASCFSVRFEVNTVHPRFRPSINRNRQSNP